MVPLLSTDAGVDLAIPLSSETAPPAIRTGVEVATNQPSLNPRSEPHLISTNIPTHSESTQSPSKQLKKQRTRAKPHKRPSPAQRRQQQAKKGTLAHILIHHHTEDVNKKYRNHNTEQDQKAERSMYPIHYRQATLPFLQTAANIGATRKRKVLPQKNTKTPQRNKWQRKN